MSDHLTVDRSSLPPQVLDWLEAEQGRTGILLYREENGQVVLERLEHIDPEMISRLQANIERFRPALGRLADS
jgi:hypothetical protein